MNSDWFTEKLRSDRAAIEAASQAVGFANIANDQQISALRQKLKTSEANLKRIREALELEQRRVEFLKSDWVGARCVIRELREALVGICSTHPDREVQAKVKEGGIFSSDSVIQRWNEYTDSATDEDKNGALPTDLR